GRRSRAMSIFERGIKSNLPECCRYKTIDYQIFPIAGKDLPPGGSCSTRGQRCVTLTGLKPQPTQFRVLGEPAGDELLQLGARHIVRQLRRRGLHQVAGRRLNRTSDTAVQGDLCRTNSVDDDARGVRGVPHLELVLQVQRDLTE